MIPQHEADAAAYAANMAAGDEAEEAHALAQEAASESFAKASLQQAIHDDIRIYELDAKAPEMAALLRDVLEQESECKCDRKPMLQKCLHCRIKELNL